MDTLHSLERKYLYSDYVTAGLNSPPEDAGIWESVAKLVAVGSYVAALQEPECQLALGSDIKKQRTAGVSIKDHYKEVLSSYLYKGGSDKQHVVLCIGLSSLMLFTQNNFTGPIIGPLPSTLLPGLTIEGQNEEKIKEEALESLVGDSEGVYNLLYGPEYLLLANLILVDLRPFLPTCLTIDWWCFRCALLHQRVAEERSPQLYEILLQALNQVENNQQLVNISVSRDLTALYHLEAGHLHLYFYDVGRAGDHFKKAAQALEIEIDLSGALGKRTKWQQEDRPQLVTKVEYKGQPLMNNELPGNNLLPTDLPKDVLLNDDIRLHKIKFQEQDDDVIPDLRPIEQALILSTVTHKRRSSAADLQLDQETKAYVVALLQYPKNWCFQMSALLLRSRVEATETRAMERSLHQVEELLAAVNRSEPSRYERLKLFSTSLVIPHWELQQELAKMLMRLGCIKTALEVFERLQLWEDAITCYNELQMRQRSAEVVRNQLKKGETPKLWCLLGDATDDIENYKKAWELSNHKSGRAQRSLGNYYYVRKDYNNAILHYEKSIEINKLQFPVWQRLAYCALQVEDWEKCAQAYRRCSVLEPDSFEVWNNMSQAYLKLDQKPRAWKALQEALRCKVDSWRLWDNFMLVSTSLGYMSHALNAYNRILTMKERHVDTQIIGRIVKAIVEGQVDPEGREVRGLYKRCSELLGRLTSEVPTNPELWYLYGILTRANTEPSPETRHLAMQQFKKAVAATTQKAGWEKDTITAVAVLHRSACLIDAALAATDGVSAKVAVADLNSVKMSVRGAVLGTRRGQVIVATGQVLEEVQEPLKKVEETLDILMQKLEEIKLQT
ncbi:tetratricopeptide repeat protein 27 [Procambarus clarkii]|uniref:tetratricopeptide repeat protein 27 n=1 Tax=Procambarus clarkii TaxID=6728 RepID=UPI001E672770|nr:tetratricopeptide repeat protein 27-like [Procambarus clarkii]